MHKAIALLSGGLDSTLAVKLILSQGIEVIGLTLSSTFCPAEGGIFAAEKLGIPVVVVDFSEAQYELVKNPPHGRGKHMNPCIDCHGLMLRIALERMHRAGGSFVFTGEVLGQRPFSQNERALGEVARLSGAPELVLRPLSARLLPPTEPEERGIVDRSRLLGFQGRNRKPQMELASAYGIDWYRNPAGGCKLTEPNFSHRLRDALELEPAFPLEEVEMLKVGRHFRLPSAARAVVGKSESDNERIELLAGEGDILLRSVLPGPVCRLGRGATEEDVLDAASISARYTDCPTGEPCEMEVLIKNAGGFSRVRTLSVHAAGSDEVCEMMILTPQQRRAMDPITGRALARPARPSPKRHHTEDR
jgi:tRNA-specific 2-thiouridylase